MISTSPPRRSRTLEVALALSLLLHVLGMLVYTGFLGRFVNPPEPKQEEMAATTDFVRIDKKTIPRPAVRNLVPPAPPPSVAQRPTPRRVAAAPPVARPASTPRPAPTARHELSRVTAQAPPDERAAPPAVHVPQRTTTRPAPAATAGESAAADQRGRTLSPQQLAALDQQFRTTIAQAKTDLANAPPPRQPPIASRHVDAVMLGSIHDLRRAQGEVVNHVACGNGDPHCYYLRVHIVWPDGYAELVDIPWPYHFTGRDDPFLKYGYVVFDAQSPPDTYHLPHPFALSRLLCAYYKDECQAVLDGESRAGGGPATN